ncbi:MAG: response regulator transcription factor [Acetatifactor sp.]|nr:response regulator transcription factor [Acetatifactor sp.]
MLNIVICDDEPHFQNRLSELIAGYLDCLGCEYAITCMNSGEELLQQGPDITKYDIAFLDVQMSGLDGIQTARHIREVSEDMFIVFVTAFISYSLDGYKVSAIRYVLKDESGLKDSLEECLSTIIGKMNYFRRCFEFLSGVKEVLIDKILYIESNLHKVRFFICEDKKREYQMYGKLDTVFEEMKSYGFVRIHQSYMVNMKYVISVERYIARLVDGTEINISKKYYKETMTAYMKARGNV